MHDSRYRSFIVRVWVPGGEGAIRVEIERIQTGMRIVLKGAVAEHIVAVIDPDAGSGPVPGHAAAPVIDTAAKGRPS